jgi:hypothetical protein
MKSGNLLLISGLGLLALVLMSSKSSGSSTINLDCLRQNYDSADVDRLALVLSSLEGQGLSNEQIKYCLAQILQETGLFTNGYANYKNVDQLKNYAGISASSGGYRSYSTIDDFVQDYLRVLNLPGHYPIEATSIDDFNTRLKANHYYEDSATTYGNNLRYYYNILTNCEL